MFYHAVYTTPCHPAHKNLFRATLLWHATPSRTQCTIWSVPYLTGRCTTILQRLRAPRRVFSLWCACGHLLVVKSLLKTFYVLLSCMVGVARHAYFVTHASYTQQYVICACCYCMTPSGNHVWVSFFILSVTWWWWWCYLVTFSIIFLWQINVLHGPSFFFVRRASWGLRMGWFTKETSKRVSLTAR